MIYSENFKIQLKDIGKGKYINDRGILEIFENIATHHSDLVGFGVNDIENTKLTWMLMDWKVKIINRPKYGENLKVNTWARKINGTLKKTYTYRDYEIYNEKSELLVIGTSKWVLVNIETEKISMITEEIFERYKPENKSVFSEQEIEKIRAYETYSNVGEYEVTRRDVDLNNHLHNLYYLDFAYNSLPEEVYEKVPFNNIRISYKREIKLGDKFKCKYAFANNEYIIDIYSEDETKLHCSLRMS